MSVSSPSDGYKYWVRDDSRSLYLRSDGHSVTDQQLVEMEPDLSRATFEWLEDEVAEGKEATHRGWLSNTAEARYVHADGRWVMMEYVHAKRDMLKSLNVSIADAIEICWRDRPQRRKGIVWDDVPQTTV